MHVKGVTAPASRMAPSPTKFSLLWVVGSSLACIALVLLASLPPLPTRSDAVAEWVQGGVLALTWAGELLFFSVITWGTGAVGVCRALGGNETLKHTLALVALGLTLIAFVVVLLALGRLVYPVIGGDVAAETIKLLVSVVFGAVHLALLGLAIVALTLTGPTRSVWKRRAMLLAGAVFGALFIVGSYPWLLPAWLNFLVAAAVGCWGVLVGVVVLAQRHGEAGERSTSVSGAVYYA